MHARHSRSTEGLLKNIQGGTKAKEFQEFLACFKKNQQDVVTQDKQVVPSPLDNTTDVTRNVSTSPPLVTCEVLSNMLVDHNKTMMSQMQQTMEESIDTVLES
jgi:hypothetical protein